MNYLNTNISNNHINIQDLGISLYSPFRFVIRFIKQYLHPNKSKWAKTLLIELTKTPVTFRTISDLGSSTGLGDAVYPLLASLHRQGLVETRQFKDTRGTILTYCLTEKGFLGA